MDGFEFGLLLGGYIVVLGSLALLVYFLAHQRLFFTAPAEGTAQFVMKGNVVHDMILGWKDHRIGDNYQIEPGVQAKGVLYYANPLHWMEPFGIYWYGLWPFFKIHTYDFNWIEPGIESGTGKTILRVRHATKNEGGENQSWFVYVNDFNYFFVISPVKTMSGLPLVFVLQVTIRIENPYKALFSGEDWLQRTEGAISNMVIKYAGALEYEKIIASEKAEIGLYPDYEKKPYTLEELIKMLGDGKPDDALGTDLLKNYGVKIVASKIHSIDFADETARAELQKATTQVYVATQKGLAAQAEAKGAADAIRTTAQAEKDRIDTVYGTIAGDDLEKRMEIRRLEALEKSGSAGGNTVVIPDKVIGLGERIVRTITK